MGLAMTNKKQTKIILDDVFLLENEDLHEKTIINRFKKLKR